MSLDDLLPGSKTQKTIDEYNNKLDKLVVSRDQKAAEIALKINTLEMQIEDYRNIMENQRENLDLSQKNLAQVKENIKLGDGSSLDEINAETACQDALSGFYQAVYDYYSNLLNLIRLTEGFNPLFIGKERKI